MNANLNKKVGWGRGELVFHLSLPPSNTTRLKELAKETVIKIGVSDIVKCDSKTGHERENFCPRFSLLHVHFVDRTSSVASLVLCVF